jgi:DNA-directed RNA polymerase specialized sigma24 family protein
LIDTETLRTLDSQNWDKIIDELTLHAIFKVKRSFWRSGIRDLPKGEQIEDIVYNAIDMVYSGQRKWDRSRNQDVLQFLKGIVDSQVSHLLESAEHLNREYLNEGQEGKESPIELVVDPAQDPLSEVIANEMKDYLWDCAKGDEEMELVLCCIDEGISNRSEISDTLKMPLNTVDNTLKRIRRKLRKFLTKE